MVSTLEHISPPEAPKLPEDSPGKVGRVSLVISILAYIGLIVSDPATSPFYAIESALGTVGYALIVPTMLFVIAVAVSVSLGYIAIGIRFNRGEGGPGLVYEMLGIRPAMVAAASLIQDFVLTDAITMAATRTPRSSE